jgi:hypothetical protein
MCNLNDVSAGIAALAATATLQSSVRHRNHTQPLALIGQAKTLYEMCYWFEHAGISSGTGHAARLKRARIQQAAPGVAHQLCLDADRQRSYHERLAMF